MRRLIALAVIVAVVVLLAFLLIRGCGGSDAGAAAVTLGAVSGDWRLSAFVERQ